MKKNMFYVAIYFVILKTMYAEIEFCDLPNGNKHFHSSLTNRRATSGENDVYQWMRGIFVNSNTRACI